MFFLTHCCQSPVLGVSPSHLPRIHSQTVLVSGPAVGAARILIWSYTCVFLPPMSTAIRTTTFSFVGALYAFIYSVDAESALLIMWI